LIPNPPTGDQKMIYSLLLITQRAFVRMRKISSSQPIRYPTPVMCNQPHEKFTFAWRPTLPDSFPSSKLNGSNEHGLIGRFR
jgi:hypothetical protein